MKWINVERELQEVQPRNFFMIECITCSSVAVDNSPIVPSTIDSDIVASLITLRQKFCLDLNFCNRDLENPK